MIEFVDLLDEVTLLAGKLLLLGDFNIDVDVPYTAQFLGSLSDAGLLQHVREPTHGHGHTLDLLISRREDCLVLDSGVSNTLNSDHYVVNCTINFSKPITTNASLQCPGIIAIWAMMPSLRIFKTPFKLFLIIVILMTSTVLSVLNNHCPLTTRTHKFKTRPIWYTN